MDCAAPNSTLFADGNVINLNEVIVYDSNGRKVTGLEVGMSTTLHTMYAGDQCIDRVISSMCHTAGVEEIPVYVRVKMQSPQIISKVIIHNRKQDCCRLCRERITCATIAIPVDAAGTNILSRSSTVLQDVKHVYKWEPFDLKQFTQR